MTMKELRGNWTKEAAVVATNNHFFVFLEKFSFTVGLPASKLRLWHYDHCQPMLMRFPTKRLYSYNIKDGDEFLIDEKLG